MRMILVFALLFLAACGQGDGRYVQYGQKAGMVLDTRTGCLLIVEPDQGLVLSESTRQELTSDERFQDLSDDAKQIVIDRLSRKEAEGQPWVIGNMHLRPLDKERC